MVRMFQSVIFYTNKLTILQRFYQNILGLSITSANEKQFSMAIGTDQVTFIQREKPATYHFAINVPGNQFSLMKVWLQKRTSVTTDKGNNQFYSRTFDADYLFIEDPVGNMVKLIGRRNQDRFGNFTPASFLNIAEVSLITPFVMEVSEKLQEANLPLYYEAETNPDGTNYLGDKDRFISLSAPKEQERFSNMKGKSVYPLELSLKSELHASLNNKGHLLITKIDSKSAEDH